MNLLLQPKSVFHPTFNKDPKKSEPILPGCKDVFISSTQEQNPAVEKPIPLPPPPRPQEIWQLHYPIGQGTVSRSFLKQFAPEIAALNLQYSNIDGGFISKSISPGIHEDVYFLFRGKLDYSEPYYRQLHHTFVFRCDLKTGKVNLAYHADHATSGSHLTGNYRNTVFYFNEAGQLIMDTQPTREKHKEVLVFDVHEDGKVLELVKGDIPQEMLIPRSEPNSLLIPSSSQFHSQWGQLIDERIVPLDETQPMVLRSTLTPPDSQEEVQSDQHQGWQWSTEIATQETSSRQNSFFTTDGKAMIWNMHLGEKTLYQSEITCLEPATGEVLWSRNLKHYSLQGVFEDPDGKLVGFAHYLPYRMAGESRVFRLNPDSGEFLWEEKTGPLNTYLPILLTEDQKIIVFGWSSIRAFDLHSAQQEGEEK